MSRTPQIDKITYEYTNPREVTIYVESHVTTERKVWVDADAFGDEDNDDYERGMAYADSLSEEVIDRIYREGVGTKDQEVVHGVIYAEFE